MPPQPTTLSSPYPPFPPRTTHSPSPARLPPAYKPTYADVQTYEDIKLNTPLLNGEDPEKGGIKYQHGMGSLRRAFGTSGRVLAGVAAMGAFVVLIWWIATRVWRDGE